MDNNIIQVIIILGGFSVLGYLHLKIIINAFKDIINSIIVTIENEIEYMLKLFSNNTKSFFT